MSVSDIDHRVRLAAFAFLAEQTGLRGETLPRSVLEAGFIFDSKRVALVGPQGIFKPAVAEIPLTITTSPVVEGKKRPYEDEVEADGLIKYRYRGTDPSHHENVGLRRAMQRQIPLIYLYGIVPGSYMPLWPVFIVGDDPASLSFKVAVDQATTAFNDAEDPAVDPGTDARRRYITVVAQRRLHQRSFRDRVVRAYRMTCAICRLKHEELLDAAHILPDGHPRGEPTVSNGLALCKLHHAAFDQNIIGVRPNLTVDVRLDILAERDGPMLEHGLQGFQDSPLVVPRATVLRPNVELVAERYEMFRKAG